MNIVFQINTCLKLCRDRKIHLIAKISWYVKSAQWSGRIFTLDIPAFVVISASGQGAEYWRAVEGETVYVRVDAFLEEPHACTSEEKNQSLE